MTINPSSPLTANRQHLPRSSSTSCDEFSAHATSRARDCLEPPRVGRASAPSTSTIALSTSLNQKTPARSYFHSSYNGPQGDIHQYSSLRVREETAELASYALSDVASGIATESSSPKCRSSSPSRPFQTIDSYFGEQPHGDGRARYGSDQFLHVESIEEVSEPVSPASAPSLQHPSAGTSALTEMLKNSQSSGSVSVVDDTSRRDSQVEARATFMPSKRGVSTAPINEGTSLLPKSGNQVSKRRARSPHDVESQHPKTKMRWRVSRRWLDRPRRYASMARRTIASPKTWNARTLWGSVIAKPASYIPAVILGLLLNVLDALSYGMILFPLGQPVFADLGPEGISIFYVSCIISQLVYSCGGSSFRGGIGSEMIEVVPFFHKMAFTILARVGDDNPKAVLATTILSYSMSSVITGLVFFGMGACRLGSLIGFFPRHILIGCIGGVGWFLFATGLEVSARLDGSVEYNLSTLQRLFQFDTVFLWMAPLILAVFLVFCQLWVKHPLFVPGYFMLIAAVFYFFVAAIPNLNLEQLRGLGWIFDMPPAGVPFYSFYKLYDFNAVDWAALLKTVPAMFALTFFGVLHVPINVPALGFSTGQDEFNVDRELVAHGLSNALSGIAGSIQNYLVYTNSLLFIRSGGDSRVAGVMLAIGTAGILVVGPTIIGYIPIMVVGSLIFLLGIELLREALYDTWGRVHRLEYLTIVAIVLIMGAWDFVIGIFAGIVLACVSFVVQTSQKSAIRATLTGQVAGSTVRRNPAQYRFLRRVGQQIHVIKLAGFLFFGTIVSVENRIRALLDEEAFTDRPIRFLIVDFGHVTGIDFSAAEAFTRMNRILKAKYVSMIVCGVVREGEIGRSLRSVGLWDDEDGVRTFDDLNSALEFCENELLRTFYSRRDTLTQPGGQQQSLDVPKSDLDSVSFDTIFSSPRRQHLHQAAQETLHEQDQNNPSKWQKFKQPLPLILQTFQGLTDKNEDFWFPACQFFERREYTVGTTLFRRGDPPDGFYLLQHGIFRAEYHLPQGRYYESIVAGTTCGELPFFSGTERTATVVAERDCIAWLLSTEKWEELQNKFPDIAQELLKISLKLTSERMAAITSYVLTTAG